MKISSRRRRRRGIFEPWALFYSFPMGAWIYNNRNYIRKTWKLEDGEAVMKSASKYRKAIGKING